MKNIQGCRFESNRFEKLTLTDHFSKEHYAYLSGELNEIYETFHRS